MERPLYQITVELKQAEKLATGDDRKKKSQVIENIGISLLNGRNMAIINS